MWLFFWCSILIALKYFCNTEQKIVLFMSKSHWQEPIRLQGSSEIGCSKMLNHAVFDYHLQLNPAISKYQGKWKKV